MTDTIDISFPAGYDDGKIPDAAAQRLHNLDGTPTTEPPAPPGTPDIPDIAEVIDALTRKTVALDHRVGKTAETDPTSHEKRLTTLEANTQNVVLSVNGQPGPNPSLGYVEVGADQAGTATGLMTTHVSAADPHVQYQKEAEKDQVGGYAGIDVSTGKILAALIPVVAITNTFPVQNEGEMLALGSHVPPADTGDLAIRADLPGTFVLAGNGDPSVLGNWIELPNPAGGVISVQLGAGSPITGAVTIPADGSAGTASLRTLGSASTQAAPGNDSRFTDARTPLAHAASHGAGGSDPVIVDGSQISGAGTIADALIVSTIARTSDARFTDSRTPTGTAGGDLTGSYPNPSLGTSGVTASTYGDASHTTQVTFDAKGRATAASSVAITLATSAVTGLDGALSAKAPLNAPVFTGVGTIPTGWSITAPTGLVKSDVGLANVDNTSDAAKPVSTATSTALGLKLNATDVSVTNARTPTAHASSHRPGGTDAVLHSYEMPQDVSRRAGSVYAAQITTASIVDVWMGDSIPRGAGATMGSTDSATVFAQIENREAGLIDPGPGLILCNEDESAYGALKWSSLTQGTAGTTGPSAGAGTSPATNWVLSTNGHTIGHTTTFRKVTVFYEKQASSAATIQISTDNGSTWSADQSTTGSGYGSFTSADLGTAVSRVLKVKTTSTGSAKIIGARFYQTDASSGLVIDNISHGGTATADWLTNRGWETWLTLVAPRRVVACYGGNDFRNGVAVATAASNLATIFTRLRAAAPLTEIVYMIPQFFGLSTDTQTLSDWTTNWIPAMEAAALAAGATIINLYDRFGDCSKISPNTDPYSLTMDNGLHFTAAGQRARAEFMYERLSHSYAKPAVGVSKTFTGTTRFDTSTIAVQYDDGTASDGKVLIGTGNIGVPIQLVQLFKASGDANPAAAINVINGVASWGIGPGGTGVGTTIDVSVTRTGTAAALAAGTWTFPGPIATGSLIVNGFAGGGSVTVLDSGSGNSPGVAIKAAAGDTNPAAAFGLVAGVPTFAFGAGGASVADWAISRTAAGTAKVAGTLIVSDLLTIQDDGDATKQAKFQLSGITAGQTRTYTLPDASGTVALLASPAFTGTPTMPNWQQNDGTAAHGAVATSTLAASNQALYGLDNSGDTLPNWVVGRLAGLYANVGLYLAPANSAADVSLQRTGTATAQLTGQVTVATGITMGSGINIATNTTTGTIFGVTSSQKIGFWGATAIARGSAFTQTYSTSSHTHAALTSTDLSGISTSTTGSALTAPDATYVQATWQLNMRRIQDQFNNLKADVTNLKQVMNAVVDDVQAVGLLA